MAELQLPKLTTRVRFPSSAPRTIAFIAQSVERIHGKDEVTSSILVKGSNTKRDSREGVLFCVAISVQSRSGHFPPCHGGAPDAKADGIAGAEASMSRSRPKRDAKRAIAREHRCAGLATQTGEGYPPAKSIRGKDEV
jgi:hypothetical protein